VKDIDLGRNNAYIGVGEKMEDLQLFNGEEFVDSFFKKR
jgi:fused signal recognition particle receptor